MPGTQQVLNKYILNEQTTEKLKLNGYAVFKEWAYENIRGRDLEVGEHTSNLGPRLTKAGQRSSGR